MKFFHWLKLLLVLCWLPLVSEAMPGFYLPWGKDADIQMPEAHGSPNEHQPSLFASPLTWTAQKAISFHQNILSPVDGPRSHFRPSSSQYMSQAITRHGLIKGFILGCDRLLRENSDEWVYRTVEYEGKLYKWNPPP